MTMIDSLYGVFALTLGLLFAYLTHEEKIKKHKLYSFIFSFVALSTIAFSISVIYVFLVSR